ncbi:GNAT family N-acetyltransferase [Halobacillus sp. H74]|uniref:GNAT family N-acetyltransferase n=1 Tax=Halobacillus sp. H74 TaxID=3457436 RepID=UPI003FCC82B9
MTMICEKDPIKFYTHVESLLMDREAENNLPLGLLERMKDSSFNGEHYLVHIQKSDKSMFMSMRTPPHLWILPSLINLEPEHLSEFARYLHKHHYEVPGVLGERTAVKWFIDEWHELTKQKYDLHMEQGIYRLDELKPIAEQSGELVKADQTHKELAEEWMRQFSRETNEPDLYERASELVNEMIETGRLYLWSMEGKPVSMVSRARTTKNGATINSVFTPDEYKRNGYASQAVWHLTGRLLKMGYKFCALYTDLANPTSNSIYQKLGYKRVGDSVVYKFRK